MVHALANRGNLLVAATKLNAGRADFEAAIAADPGHAVSLAGAARLALRRGDSAEARDLAARAVAAAPGYMDPAITRAAAELALGNAVEAEAAARALLAGPGLHAQDRVEASFVLADSLDAQRRFEEAFAEYGEVNRLTQEMHRARFEGRQGTTEYLRAFTAALQGRSFPQTPRPLSTRPVKTHVFLAGFLRSGTTLLEQVLEGHPDIVTMPEKECMIDAARDLLSGPEEIEGFCALSDDKLDRYREAYWSRVEREGYDARGKVFVDKHPFHSFKLPLIARLFPDARILFAVRDPRDTVLSCYRHRFAVTDPMYQMLTLEGTAALYTATMDFMQASDAAFGLQGLTCPLESLIADFDGETQRICAYLGIEWSEGMRDFAEHVGSRGVFTPSAPQIARGLNARGVGKWREYEAQMAPVLAQLQPWVERFGYS
jgi:tetratricopeptide (TPR) repeat protein